MRIALPDEPSCGIIVAVDFVALSTFEAPPGFITSTVSESSVSPG